MIVLLDPDGADDFAFDIDRGDRFQNQIIQRFVDIQQAIAGNCLGIIIFLDLHQFLRIQIIDAKEPDEIHLVMAVSDFVDPLLFLIQAFPDRLVNEIAAVGIETLID